VPGANQVNIAWTPTAGVQYRVQRAVGGCGASAAPFETLASGLSTGSFLDSTASGATLLGYRVQSNDSANACPVSADSSCVEITPSGSCTAPPRFNGVSNAASALTANCGVNLAWAPASSSCATSTLYNIYRGNDSLFTPSAANLVATVSSATGTNLPAPNANLLSYIVRAKDASSGSEETNQFLLSAAATGSLADGTFLTGAEIGDPILGEGATGAPELARAPDAPEHVGWHINSTQAHTGLRSYESTIGSNYCLSIETPVLRLSSGQASTFSFWTKHGLPVGGRDGGTLEISVNGGPWAPATFTDALPGAITQAGNACGVPVGRAIFNGTQNTWGKFSVDLAAQAGNQVRFRFLLATGSSVQAGLLGWLVDDVELTHAELPGACTVLSPDALLRDGFE
jgi:hypothetical protein